MGAGSRPYAWSLPMRPVIRGPSLRVFTKNAARNPNSVAISVAMPLSQPPCSYASGSAVWAIMVSIAPAAAPSKAAMTQIGTPTNRTLPTKAPTPMKSIRKAHIPMIRAVPDPCVCMPTALDMASGTFGRNNPASSAAPPSSTLGHAP